MSKTLRIELPDDVFVAMQRVPHSLAGELRMAAAVKLYELGRLSSGSAALLAGLPRVVFLAKLADYGVDTFQESKEDLQREARLA